MVLVIRVGKLKKKRVSKCFDVYCWITTKKSGKSPTYFMREIASDNKYGQRPYLFGLK